jgi:hypothetical protein
LLRIVDDAGTVFSQAIVLVVRGSGNGVNWANVVELSRTKLRPDPGEAQAQTGWSIAHRGSYLGWCVLKDGEVRQANLPSEAAARVRVNIEIGNTAQMR